MKDRIHALARGWPLMAIALVILVAAFAIARPHSPPGAVAAPVSVSAGVQLEPADETRLVQALQTIQARQLELQTAQANLTAAQQFYRAEAAEVIATKGYSPKTHQVTPEQATENGIATAHLWIKPIPTAAATPEPVPRE